jgi:hypothetical protein
MLLEARLVPGSFLRGKTLGGTVGGFTSPRGAFVLFARATADGVHELRDPHLRPIGSASGCDKIGCDI